MFPGVFKLSLFLIAFILVREIIGQTTKNNQTTLYTKKQAKIELEITTLRVNKDRIVDQVTKQQDLSFLDVKYLNNGTAGKSEVSHEENQAINILNDILQYSDVISESLQDYDENPINLHSDTESKYNKNVSKLMAIEKSKAKENIDDTSETESVEGSDNTDIITSTESYENEITKTLLPSLNLSVTHNASKRFQLENTDMLQNKKRLKEVNLHASHKPKSSKELSLRNNNIKNTVNERVSSSQVTTKIAKSNITKCRNNNTIKLNKLKTFDKPTTGERNIINKDKPLFNVTRTLKTSDYTLKSINKSKNASNEKTSPVTLQYVTDVLNKKKTQILNKVKLTRFDNTHKKVGHESFSKKTISNNVKYTFTPCKLAKNSTILDKLVHIVKELNNILSISSEIDTKSDHKVINGTKKYQLSPKKKSNISSKSTDISYFNYNTKMHKPVQTYKIRNAFKQNKLIKSQNLTKISENLKKKSQTKQKYRNTKVNKAIKINKVENTTLTHKNNSIITAQVLKVSNTFFGDEEIKTPTDKGLNRALQIFDNYVKVLNSNKIKDIIDQKTKSNSKADNAGSINEVYQEYDKQVELKRLRVKSKQKANNLERNRDDNKFSEVIENCGVSNFTTDQELTSIENLPWLGVLCYRESKHMRRFANVILVTKNMVIASALDIYKIPKAYFRQRSKVVLGRPCNHRPGFRVLEYSYHPEYGKTTYSSIALLQLDVIMETVLHPICVNPTKLIKPEFHAFVLPYICKQTSVNIYRMNLLDLNLCKSYYDGIGLNTASVWPKKALCGIALQHGGCIWRNGVALVGKHQHRWHLMGFGVNGPGCGAPSRFVDFSVYGGWVARSIARVGRPALTRLADNHLVLRRSNGILGRHGPCDPFEKQSLLYRNHYETTKFDNRDLIKKSGVFRYNITLHPSYDYFCIEMIASSRYKVPLITMRSYNVNQTVYKQLGFVNYSIKVYFSNALDISITAYGKKTRGV